jgi:hypothetical protein
MPKWNGRYQLIVRLGATAKEKESSLPVESSIRVFGAKVHRGPNESCLAIDFVIIGRYSKLRPDLYKQQDNGRLR